MTARGMQAAAVIVILLLLVCAGVVIYDCWLLLAGLR